MDSCSSSSRHCLPKTSSGTICIRIIWVCLKNADTQAFPTSVTSEFLPVGPRNLYFQQATRWFLSTLQAWQPVLEVSLHISTQYMKLLISEFYSQDTCSLKFLRAPHRSPPYCSYHLCHERHSTRQCGCISTKLSSNPDCGPVATFSVPFIKGLPIIIPPWWQS